MTSTVTARLRANSGLVAGFLAQALQYGAGLILLPFVVSRLAPAEVGIWYVFLAAQSLAVVADFGFQPTLARFFALATSGASQVSREGVGQPSGRQANLALTHSLLDAARRLYLGLAAGVFALLVIGGSLYIVHLARAGGLPSDRVLIAWLAFALAITMHLYFLWIPALLLGTDRITANYSYLILSRGGFALFGIGVLLAGGGLIALAVGYLASQFAARLLAIRLLRGTIATEEKAGPPSDTKPIFAALLPNATRLGLVGIGAFLISRYNVFLLASTVGLEQAARYAIALQIFMGIASVAQLPAQAWLPRIVAARVDADIARFRRLVFAAAAFYLAAFVAGATLVIAAGNPLLDLIGSKVALLDTPLLILLATVIALEGFHSLAAFVITTGNVVPFVWPALLSGIAVALSATTAVWAGYGVLGVVVCQGLVQLAYNNWKWPLMVSRECRI